MIARRLRDTKFNIQLLNSIRKLFANLICYKNESVNCHEVEPVINFEANQSTDFFSICRITCLSRRYYAGVFFNLSLWVRKIIGDLSPAAFLLLKEKKDRSIV